MAQRLQLFRQSGWEYGAMLKFPPDGMLKVNPARLTSAKARVFTGPERLLDESERRLIKAASSSNPDEELVARRLLNDASLYSRWESEHGSMLRRCFDAYHVMNPVALLSASLALVHRKGFFQFLKDHAMNGGQRAFLVRCIFGHPDCERLIIREHGNYIRSSASLICIGHLGTTILEHPAFGSPLLDYEELYCDYFSILCRATMARKSDPFLAYHRGLVRSMKRRLDLRRTILLRFASSEMDATSADGLLH